MEMACNESKKSAGPITFPVSHIELFVDLPAVSVAVEREGVSPKRAPSPLMTPLKCFYDFLIFRELNITLLGILGANGS